MIEQQLFNILVTVCGILGGWFLKVLDANLKEAREQNKSLSEKLASMEVLVAGQYVRKDDLDRHIDAIFKKLDRIEAKIDLKADK
jgi:hypothetical protein